MSRYIQSIHLFTINLKYDFILLRVHCTVKPEKGWNQTDIFFRQRLLYAAQSVARIPLQGGLFCFEFADLVFQSVDTVPVLSGKLIDGGDSVIDFLNTGRHFLYTA